MSDDIQEIAIPEVTSDRPEGLPEKFQSVEAMATSYAELEKKLHSGTPAEESTPETPVVETAEVEEVSTDISEFEQEYRDSGALSEESYTKLKKVHNLSKQDVQDLIEIRTQKAQAEATKIFSSIGAKRFMIAPFNGQPQGCLLMNN
jgi:hypothetical protein